MKNQKDMRRVKDIPPMSIITPYIMTNRIGSMNLMRDSISVSKIDKYIKEKQAEGMTNLTLMHVLMAAYIRLISQRPQLNRFIRGQRVWTRKSIEIALTIKKEMNLNSPDTVVKVTLSPDATIKEVYEKFNTIIEEYRQNPESEFDSVAGALSYVPGIILRSLIGCLRMLDYVGLMPKLLQKVSPFHCSMFITSMASLGIPPIYHHLYDFGTCPVFIAFGAKKREYKVNPDGSVYKDQTVDFTFSCDERICDGYYYASGLKMFKGILKDPWQLDNPPEKIAEDVA
ncbi:MAG: 2-oxo acid dehydrogenase subunit E2 [Clostridia bacterium]|nr:2-oxo acid dehydrogenase subunit E2 [Clostridia bacterium]